MKCPNWGKILAAAALCAALCACSKPQDVLPDHIATPEASGTVAPTTAVVQVTATPAPTDTTVPTILPQTADAGRSYVDDTLFIGDSNTVRYTMYANDTGTAFSTLKNNIGVVSMGAGSITSNVKSDKLLVVVKDGTEQIETGRKKVGAMLGDRVEVGCNSVLNPGTVIGPDSNVYPTSCVRGVIPAGHVYKDKDHIIAKK